VTGLDPQGFSICAAALIAGGLVVAARRPAWVVRFPRSVLLLLAVVTLFAVAALVRLDPPGLRLAIDASTEPLLPLGDPATDTYREAVVDFGDDEVFVIAMETDDLFTAANLEALRRVGNRLSRIDGVRDVTSLARVTSFRYEPDSDWIEVRPFLDDEVPEDPAALAALRDRALQSPIYRDTLVSPDGRTAAINVSFREMTDGDFIAADLDGRIQRILEDESRDGLRFYVSGGPHIKSQMYHTMVRDLGRLIPLALAVVAAVLVLVSGTLRGVVLPLGTVGAAVLWTFGAMALLARPLTVLSVLLAPTLVAVGSVYGVHVVSRYEEEVQAGGGRREVVLRCLVQMIDPVLIAGLTTVVGFGALLLTDVPAVFEVGAFSVLGVAAVTLISLTGIPAALVLLPLRGSAARRLALSGRLARGLDAALAGLARAARRAPGVVVAAWALAVAASLALIPRIVIDTDYLSHFDADSAVRRDFDAVNRLLAGTVPLYVVVDGGGRGTLRDPQLLHALAEVQTRIDALPGVSRTLSFLDTMRVLNRAVEGDDPAEERLPGTRGGISELFFLIPKTELARFATVDHSRANLIVRTGEVGSAAMRRLTEGIGRVLGDEALPAGVRAQVTGNAILVNRAADGVARSQPRTVGLAALTIFALLALGLRSLRLGLVAMVPNVVPVLIFYGVLGSGAAYLSLATSLIGSVALGIAIDATVHFLVRYRAERVAGATPEQAALHCGRNVGRPIAIASLMLAAGFLSVTFSQFSTLREFGWLTAMTMAVCCFTDLLLLPALLVRLRL
jgi:predicted RND superfamily exporter protein